MLVASFTRAISSVFGEGFPDIFFRVYAVSSRLHEAKDSLLLVLEFLFKRRTCASIVPGGDVRHFEEFA